MKKTGIFIVACLLLTSLHAQVKKTQSPVKKGPVTAQPGVFKNSNDSASYALGIRVAQNLKMQGFGDVNVALLQRAMGDVLQNKKQVLPELLLDQCINTYIDKVTVEKNNARKKVNQSFFDNNAKRPGVVTLPSGLQYEVMKAGTSDIKPSATDKVKCHYHGTLVDGTIFDSSVDRGEPIVFAVNGVIRGWQEALQLMTVGSKWKLYVPSDLAYGEASPSPKIPPGSILVFEVELLSIEKE